VACGPLLLGYYPFGHDSIIAIERSSAYVRAILEGQFPPLWASDFYYGLGSPIFLFYAPFFSVFSALVFFLVGKMTMSIIIVLIFFTAVSMFGMYKVTTKAFGNNNQIVRLSIYLLILHPYILGNKFIRSANSEFLALSLLPFCIWGVLELSTNKRFAYWLLTLSLSFSILAHNLTGLVTLSIIIALGAILYWDDIYAKGLVIALSILSALGLTLFFWLPAISLTHLVRVGELTSGRFHHSKNFTPSLEALSTVYELIGIFSFIIITYLLASWLASTATDIFKKRILIASALGFSILIFLVTPFSRFLWDTLPLIHFFQFPWRFFGPSAIFTSLLISYLFSRIIQNKTKMYILILESFILLILTILAWQAVYNTSSFSKGEQERLEDYAGVMLSKEDLFSATVVDEYLPKTASISFIEHAKAAPVVFSSDSNDFIVIEDAGHKFSINSFSKHPYQITFSRWYFSGWAAEINNHKLTLSPDINGLITTTIPEGNHEVSIKYRGPKIFYLAALGSMISIILIALLYYFLTTRR
jgi:hypothetical protein